MKTRKGKKIIASVLSVFLIFGSVPMASLAGVDLPELPSISSLLSVKASAANALEATIDGVTYYYTIGSGCTITGVADLSKLPANYTIPEKLNGTVVTGIGNSVFSGAGVTTLTVPEKITSMGVNAFANCPGLKTVYFNTNSCTITNATAGSYYDDNSVFYNCPSLTKVVFGENVTSVSAGAFRMATSLENVKFDAQLTDIGAYAFYNCTSLTDVYCPNMTESYWNDNVKANIGSNNDILLDKNIYRWGEMPEVKTVTVKFDIDGKITSYSGEAGAALSAPQAKKDGYEFTGWSPAFSGKYPDADTTYTAQFKKIGTDPQESEPITVSDASTKVGVTYDKDAFDEDVQLVTTEIKDITLVKGSFVLTGLKQVCLYDAYMKNSKGEKVQPNKKVTIKIPIPQNMWGKVLNICHIDDSGNRKYFENLKVENGFIALEINHFSSFIVYDDIVIKGYTSSLSVDYKSKLTFNADAADVDENNIHWFVNGIEKGTGSSYTIDSAVEKEYTIQIKVIVDGETVSKSEVETVKVKTDFFAKIIAFFRGLFGMLPQYVDNTKVR